MTNTRHDDSSEAESASEDQAKTENVNVGQKQPKRTHEESVTQAMEPKRSPTDDVPPEGAGGTDTDPARLSKRKGTGTDAVPLASAGGTGTDEVPL